MPDWSYLTLLAPALRRLDGRRARDLTLGAFGTLGRVPGGQVVIAAFGHMRPSADADVDVVGLRLRSRVGIGGEVDPRLVATEALGCLGVGFLEIGPISVRAVVEGKGPRLRQTDATIWLQREAAALDVEAARRRLADRVPPAPLLVRLAARGQGAAAELTRLARELEPFAAVADVLVPEDVRFLDMPTALLRDANPRLLPLVAHDRAGFGGALVSDGLGVLLTSLWGFREGARWLWWTLLVAGVAGFGGALGVHFAVGYLDVVHLAPACLGLVLFATGLGLSYPYLCRPRI